MTAPHYQSSVKTVILGGFSKYAFFPLAFASALAATRDMEKAKLVARIASTALSTVVTSTFFGLESKMIDDTGREAVSAAMGVDPDKLQFSDYTHSSNSIIREGATQFLHLQKYRYATDFMFMLPSLVEHVGKGLNGGKDLMRTKDVKELLDSRTDASTRTRLLKANDGKEPGFLDIAVKGHHGIDMSVYGANAAYWAYETFMIPKTGYYSIVKHLENNEGTGKDMSVGDLWEIYQRTRSDKHLPMIALDAKPEYDALRPLLKRMVDEYNKHDGKFNKAEMVYLLGENKINIHAGDGRTLSEAAVAQSNKEIDKVLAIGLSGIREENRALREKGGMPGQYVAAGIGQSGFAKPGALENRSFVERVTNTGINTAQNILSSFGMIPKRPIQPISPRDPAGLLQLNSTVGR